MRMGLFELAVHTGRAVFTPRSKLFLKQTIVAFCKLPLCGKKKMLNF
jgi:hypothetical protein